MWLFRRKFVYSSVMPTLSRPSSVGIYEETVTAHLLGMVSNKILRVGPNDQAYRPLILRYPFSIWLVVGPCLCFTWQPVPNSTDDFDSGAGGVAGECGNSMECGNVLAAVSLVTGPALCGRPHCSPPKQMRASWHCMDRCRGSGWKVPEKNFLNAPPSFQNYRKELSYNSSLSLHELTLV
jgi:hypothetical protein